MKKAPVDFASAMMSTYLHKKSFVNKFIKYWGTTTINGEEVLNYINEVWWERTGIYEHQTKMLKHIGAYENIRDSNKKGLWTIWLFLNPGKDVALADSVIVENLNKFVEANKREVTYTELVNGVVTTKTKYVVDLVIRLDANRYSVRGEFGDRDYSDDPYMYIQHANYEDLRNKLVLNKDLLLKNYRVTARKYGQEEVDTPVFDVDPYYSVLSRYSVFYDSTAVITYAGKGLRRVDSRGGDEYSGYWPDIYYIPFYQIKYTIDADSYNVDDEVVKRIHSDASFNYRTLEVDNDGSSRYGYDSSSNVSGYITQTELQAIYGSELLGLYNVTGPTRPEWWVQGPPVGGGSLYASSPYYLKVSVLKGPGLSLDEKIELISNLIDSGYREKSMELWETVATIVVIVVAFYYLGPYAAQGGMYVAKAILAFALVVTVTAAVAYAAGAYGLAQSMAQVNTTIAPAVQIATIAMIIDFVSNTRQTVMNSLDDAAMKGQDAAASSAGYTGSSWTGATGAVATRSTAEILVEAAKDWVYNTVKSWDYSDLVDITGNVVNQVTSLELESLAKKNKRLEEQVAEQNAALEEYKYADYGRVFISSFTNLLGNDWSDYVYDTPYEPTRGSMHTGCIQANRVIAMMGDSYKTYSNNLS